LFARALQLAATHTSSAVCRRISEAANTVCTGEILQNQRSFDLHLALDQYLDIIHQKTGALFALSAEVGATLNGAALPVVEQLHEFGGQLGIAYQIYDDCVDVLDREDRAGKSLGTDMKKGKLTLPFLLLLEHTAADRRGELGEVIFHGAPADRQRLLQLALNNGVVAESLLTIDRHVQHAERQLAGLPANPHSAALRALLTFIASRSRQLWQEAGAR
jgi:octaprenyl-diphosphate synthase